MRNLDIVKILCYAGSATIVFAVLAVNVTPAVAEVLFLDTFSAGAYNENISAGVADPGRQSGTLTPITYTQANYADKTYVGGELVEPALSLNPQCVSMHGNLGGWSGISPNQDFGGANSAGGQIIEYDVAPWYGNWVFTHIGYDHAPTSSDPYELHFDTTSHLSFFILGPYYQIWDSGTEIVGFGATLPDGLDVSGISMHHVKIVCTDPTDGNPFNGVGQTDLDFYVDDLYVNSYSKGSGGYANNYVSLQGYLDHSEWDNLQISQVPEPGTLVLLAMGVLGLIYVIRRS